MSLQPSTRLGPYEIISSIGAGGMGEVYRARDTRLNRIVAVKVLPEHLSNPQLRERFEREARAISSLSHPHICALYDVGQQNGIEYLVMEHLEGETLAGRLKKGPLPTDQVLQYAIQITDALDTAHKHAVIHRDLKPGNIMLTKTGAKLLDFGLAKVRAAEAVAGMTAAPTQTTPLTGEGTILGTLQYMAPEQLEGKEADARTDIFALGAVIYEMATGRKAFEGKSQASLISAIMTAEPPSISTLQSMAPPPLDHVVRSCLAKEPEMRWQTAHDVLVELKWIVDAGSQAGIPKPVVAHWKRRELFSWALTAVVSLALLVLAFVHFRQKPTQARPFRFSVSPPEKVTLSPAAPAVSPDGSLLAFLAATEGRSMIWIRAIDSLVARPLAGSDWASTMFWSPDSHFLAFIARGKLKKIELSTGSVSTICDADSNTQGDWNGDGIIVLSMSKTRPLHRVQAAGGVPTQLTALDPLRGDFSHSWPQWLPDSRNFLYFVETALRETTGIYAAALGPATAASKLIVESYAAGRYASPRSSSTGHLLFLDGDALMAQSFNPSSVKLTGEPMRIAEQVGGLMVEYAGNPGFSISQNGVLAYHSITGPRSQLVWLDRAGTPH
jgi:serine/threonine protein kinase